MTISLAKPPSPVDLQTAADIDRMHEIITANGWIQDAYYDRVQVTVQRITPARARVDMYGALNIVLCDVPAPLGVLTVDRQRRHHNVVRAIGGHLQTIGFYFWQHDPERTAEDVLDALKATAAKLRGES